MLIGILIFNLLLAMLGFWLAWQIWQWRQALANAADVLLEAERITHEVLNEAPIAITAGQTETHQLRQSYRQLTTQYRQVQRVLGWVNWSRRWFGGQRNPLPLLRKIQSHR